MICVSGFVYDQTGDFNNSFYMAAVIGFLGGCLSLSIVVRNCFHKQSPHIAEETQEKDVDQSTAHTVYVDDMGSQILHASKTSINTSKL